MIDDDITQPDDLAPGVYRDADGDLWAVTSQGTAHVLTDVVSYELELIENVADIVLDELGEGMPADEAHAAYTLRMFLPA